MSCYDLVRPAFACSMADVARAEHVLLKIALRKASHATSQAPKRNSPACPLGTGGGCQVASAGDVVSPVSDRRAVHVAKQTVQIKLVVLIARRVALLAWLLLL